MNKLLAVLASTLLPLLAAAQAPPKTPQVIWRCGAEGRSYSDSPCHDGRSYGRVEVAAARGVIPAAQTPGREAALPPVRGHGGGFTPLPGG